MNHFGLAQAAMTGYSALESDFAQHAVLVGAIYGVLVLIGLVVDSGLILYWRTHRNGWREHASRLCWRPWSPRDVGQIILLLIGLHALVILGQPMLNWVIEKIRIPETSALIVVQSIIFHWAGLGLVAWSLWRRRIPWKSAFGIDISRFPRYFTTGVMLLLGAMPLLLFYTMLYHFGLEMSGHETTLQDVAFAISDETSLGLRIYFVLLATVIAPLFEEMLFRGIGLPVLAQRMGMGSSIVLISLLFALIHGHVPSLVPLFLLSVALCLAYIYTESILVPVIMHGLFNALTVTLLMSIR